MPPPPSLVVDIQLQYGVGVGGSLFAPLLYRTRWGGGRTWKICLGTTSLAGWRLADWLAEGGGCSVFAAEQ